MGSLAVPMNWIPEDDRLLKNALESGASLESLAKGAVNFSRKFTLCELQERWHCLLYDIDTSTKASAKILEIEMEQAAANNLNSNQAFTYNVNDSVRSHYYARQKRICVAPQSFDFGDQPKNDSMQVDNFNEAPEAQHFLSSYSNQIGYDDGMVGDDGSLFGCTDNNNMSCMSLDGIECDIGNPSIEENFQQNDFPHILGENLISLDNTLNDSDSRSPLKYELEIQKLNSHDRGQSSSQSDMNIWNMDKGNDLNKINASMVTNLDDYDNASNDDIMSGAGFPDPPFMSDHDLMILTNTDMDDLLLIDDNEVDNKNKLLNSDLLGAPSETYHDLFNLIEPIAATLVDAYLEIEISDQDVHSFSTQMNASLQSVYGIDIPSDTFSQITNSFIPCCMNMRAGLVPDNNNNDMSHLKQPFSVSSSSRHKRLKLKNSFLSFSDKNDSNEDLCEGKEHVVAAQPQVSNSMANSVKAETSKVVNAPAQVDALKEENQENLDDFGSYLEDFLQENNDINDNDLDSMTTCQEGAKTRILLLPVTATSDQEQSLSESEDVPYTSDVEDMILGMDLSQYGGESYPIAKEVSKHQQLDTKEMIRLEQSLHSHVNRSIASNGAYAVFFGRHLKYFIRNPQVTIGRETDDNQVDIDLQREGRANKISRRQAIIKMDEGGVFYMQNLGRTSIFVDGKEVLSKRCTKLPSNSLIRIHGLQFMFDVYEAAVRRYIIDKKHHTSNPYTLEAS